MDMMEPSFQEFESRSPGDEGFRPLETPAPGKSGGGIGRFHNKGIASGDLEIMPFKALPLHFFPLGVLDLGAFPQGIGFISCIRKSFVIHKNPFFR